MKYNFKQDQILKDKKTKIEQMIKDGSTQVDIAKYLNVSRQRVHQLLKELSIEYKVKVRGVLKSKKQRLLESTGLSEDELKAARLKFTRKRENNKKQGNYEWGIEFTDIIWNTTCPILKTPIDYFTESRNGCSCSFDRIDNDKGYIKGNVQIISLRANSIKRRYSLEELELILDSYKNI
jgi:hypothetical protein